MAKNKLAGALDDFSGRGDVDGCDCTGDPGKTQQCFAEEVDINTIVRRFGVTGKLPESTRAPTYGDFTEVGDFRSAMNAVRMATESFMAMPAEVRAEFGNDTQRFVEFCSDERNFDRMGALGLVSPEAVQRVAGERKVAAEAVVAAEVEKRLSARERASAAGGVELSTQG